MRFKETDSKRGKIFETYAHKLGSNEEEVIISTNIPDYDLTEDPVYILSIRYSDGEPVSLLNMSQDPDGHLAKEMHNKAHELMEFGKHPDLIRNIIESTAMRQYEDVMDALDN